MIGDYMRGFCPMGCGDGLVIGPDRFSLTCPNPQCPRPTAAHEILTDQETEHVVVLSADWIAIRHPLRERLDDALMTCNLHQYIATGAGPSHPEGRYRVRRRGNDWVWSAIESGASS